MISIHALREEGDRVAAAQFFFDFLFLSTPSARRATCCRRHRTGRRCISIHSLREEGDNDTDMMDARVGISIHALREEGDTSFCSGSTISSRFLSTPSARRATKAPAQSGKSNRISIHALREEGDSSSADSFS